MTHSDDEPLEPRPANEDAPPAAGAAQGVAGQGGAPETEDGDGGDPGETAEAVIESAAGFVVAAAVAPFAAGETGPIMGSIHDAVEDGIQRLTHLGHPHGGPAKDTATPPEGDAPAGSPPESPAAPARPPEDDPPA